MAKFLVKPSKQTFIAWMVYDLGVPVLSSMRRTRVQAIEEFCRAEGLSRRRWDLRVRRWKYECCRVLVTKVALDKLSKGR